MQRMLKHAARVQKKELPSANPISEGIMTALKPACGAIAAAFFFCANPAQPPVNNPMLPSDLPAVPIGYSINTSINGRTANIALRFIWPETTKTFYYRANYGDGSADSGLFNAGSDTIGSLSHAYSGPGTYPVNTSLCTNRAFNGTSPRSDTVTIR